MDLPRSLDELVALIERIAERLDDAGRSDGAERLRSAIEGGTTSGEILTHLGRALADLRGSADAADAGIGADIDLALDAVDASLRRAGQSPPRRG